jgi:transcription initiation factor IIF auxiliary subunit
MKVIKFNLNKEVKDLSIDQSFNYKGDNYWDWAVWIKGSETNLDKIKCVTYQLHNTFLKPVREIEDRSTNFKLKTAGWGSFTIYAMLTFKDDTVKHIKHNLKLEYPTITPNINSNLAYAK